MKTFLVLLKRNIKLFFNDKGMFLTSLITPLILLLLYVTFLGNVYKQSFIQIFPFEQIISEKVINGLVGGQLMSSILAVSCVTVAFCSNFLSVQDKVSGSANDFTISPVKSIYLSLSYYLSSLISTLIICIAATLICFIYLAITGWYLTFADVVSFLLDVVLLSLFGTILSSIVNCFIKTPGQMSAVGTMVSSTYGFICGAYMPIASFPEWLQKVLSFLPGTYGTSLMRNHAMNGAIYTLQKEGLEQKYIDVLMDELDCKIYFNDIMVEEMYKYLILIGGILILMTIYLLLMYKMRKRA